MRDTHKYFIAGFNCFLRTRKLHECNPKFAFPLFSCDYSTIIDIAYFLFSASIDTSYTEKEFFVDSIIIDTYIYPTCVRLTISIISSGCILL